VSARCPTCLSLLTEQSVQWRSADGTTATAPPRETSTFLGRLRRLAGVPEDDGAAWADWYAAGNQAYCSRGHSLPPKYLTRTTHVIGLVGESGSSKSHYIAALIQSLLEGHLGAMNLQVDLEPGTVARFHTDYYTSLFDRHEVIPASRPLKRLNSATGEHETRPPLTVTLTNWQTGHAVNLCFFDVAGEQLVDEQSQATWARHLGMADGLLFFVDPAVLRGLPGGSAGDSSGRGQTLHVTESVITTTSTIAHRGRGLSPDDDLSGVAAALVVAKADLLESRAAFPSGVLEPIDYARETPVTLGARLARESVLIEQFLEAAGARNLVMGALSKFPGLRFHAVTATGASAKEGRYHAVEPRRCLEPLLSILDQIGVVNLGRDFA
jgi:hypothetical protein